MEITTDERAVRTTADREGVQGGDDASFRLLVEPFRRELLTHCYRMLGSAEDAEEAVQDAMLRAWKGASGFEGRSSVRTWLYRIATNVCLTRLQQRSRRTLPVEMGPAAEPLDSSPWAALEGGFVEPFPDGSLDPERGDPGARYELRESVELAFIVALQHLPARQRAVLILRDVLGFSAKETAATLDTSVAAVTSALQRARVSVRLHLPDSSQQQVRHSLGDDGIRRLAGRYVDAWERGDVTEIVALLTDDVVFAMPPYPIWYSGRTAVAHFLPIGPLQVGWRLLPAGVNGQLAWGCYAWDGGRGRYVAHSVDVLTVRGDRIAEITAFLELDATDFRRFRLPPDLPAR